MAIQRVSAFSLQPAGTGCCSVTDAMNPACAEGGRWPLEEKSHRSREVKVRSGMTSSNEGRETGERAN